MRQFMSVGKLCGTGAYVGMPEINILCVVCPLDIAEVLESPEFLNYPEPLIAQGHISWDVPTVCRNLIGMESGVKL